MGRRVMMAGAAFVLAFVSARVGVRYIRAALPDSGLFLRSEADLLSLRALLSDVSVRDGLASLCGPFELCQVITDSVPASAKEDCLSGTRLEVTGEKIRHRFLFASGNDSSSRAYGVSYTTCRQAVGAFNTALERQGFSSREQSNVPAVLSDSRSLSILEKALQDPGVSSTLVDTLRQSHIAQIRVLYLGNDPADSGILRFRFQAAPESPVPIDTSILIQFDVEYSPATDEVYFERVFG